MTDSNHQPPAETGQALEKRKAAEVAALMKTKATAGTLKKALEHIGPQLEAILPRHLTKERVTKVALLAFHRTPKLAECTVGSIMTCVMTSAELGLEPGSPIGGAHLVPRWNSKARAMECTFIADYRGLMDLARRSSQVLDIRVRAARKNDDVIWTEGTTERLEVTPARGDRGEPWLYYAIAQIRDAEPHVETMTLEEVQKHRDRFAPRNRAGELVGPWVEGDFEAMAYKTLARKLCKWIPRSTELLRVLAAEDEQDRRYIDALGDAFDVSGDLANQAAASEEEEADGDPEVEPGSLKALTSADDGQTIDLKPADEPEAVPADVVAAREADAAEADAEQGTIPTPPKSKRTKAAK